MIVYAKTSTLLIASSLFVLAACSGDDNKTTSSSGGNTSLTLDQLLDKVKSAACAGAVDCHRAETEAECIATQQVNYAEIKTYVDNGTVKYRPEKVDACLAALQSESSCSLGAALSGGLGNTFEAACEIGRAHV